MGEWDLGPGWVLAILFAALAPRPADTQHARPSASPRDDRFTDEPPTRPAARGGWPPGLRSAARGVRPDRPPAPLLVARSP